MRILMIEDDRDLCGAVSFQLINEGYDVDMCHNGEDALYYALQKSHDIIILDRMLPSLDGLSILHAMRKKGIETPVIIVTAMNGLNDRIDGLDSGADDYLVKPFAVEELLARIRALSRRPKVLENTETLRFSNILLDTAKQVLKSEANSCSLSKRETQLMEYFLRNKNQILSRDMLLNHVWGPDSFVEDGNLDNYIHFLRRRLKSVESRAVIKTIHSVGYRLEEKICSPN